MYHLIAGIVMGVLVIFAAGGWWLRRGYSSAAKSKAAHERTQERAPPVEIGRKYELGVSEITPRYDGRRQAVGKVEGFVIFVEDLPTDVSEGDAIEAKVMSFNPGETSASAIFIDWA